MIKEEKITLNIFICDLCGSEERSGHSFYRSKCSKCKKDICDKCKRVYGAYLEGDAVGAMIMYGSLDVIVCKECVSTISGIKIDVGKINFIDV